VQVKAFLGRPLDHARYTYVFFSWQRCRVHFLRNLLSHVPKAGQDMVAAAM
jgi:transposase-like protein